MQCVRNFCIGIFLAAIIGGLWWLILISGVVSLILKRSYIVLVAGVLLDIWFTATVGHPWFYTGFYTVIFIGATLCSEFVRRRLLWAS